MRTHMFTIFNHSATQYVLYLNALDLAKYNVNLCTSRDDRIRYHSDPFALVLVVVRERQVVVRRGRTVHYVVIFVDVAVRRPGRRAATMAFVIRSGRRHCSGVIITAVGRTVAAAAGLFLLPLSASPAVPFAAADKRFGRRITSGGRRSRVARFVHGRITVVRDLPLLPVAVPSAGVHGAAAVRSDRSHGGVGRCRPGDCMFAAAVLFPLGNGGRGLLVLGRRHVTVARVTALVTRRPAPSFVRRR